MTVTVEWYDSSHAILHYCFIGTWTWDEYYKVLAQGRLMEKEAARFVCSINDMRQTQYLPADFIEQVRSISLTRPTTTAICVYISDDYHFTSIYKVIARLYLDTKSLYPLAKTEDAALTLIRAWFDEHPEDNTPDQGRSNTVIDRPRN